MSSCQHICMYARRRISVPDKSNYCKDGEAGGMRPRSIVALPARPVLDQLARTLRAACRLFTSTPRQAGVALPARLNPVFRRVTKRTRSLLDLSRLLQYKKQKAHQAAAARSKLTRLSIMIMQPLRIGLTLSTPASLPLCSIGKSAKAVFAFLSPTPRATTVPFHSVMAHAGKRASDSPSLHSTIVAIADRVGSINSITCRSAGAQEPKSAPAQRFLLAGFGLQVLFYRGDIPCRPFPVISAVMLLAS